MEFWLWAVIGIQLMIILGLLLKIYMMQKSAREIESGLAGRLTAETNTLIDISSRDRSMRKLAACINVQLQKLRSERQRFQQGDLELKESVTNISHDLRTPLTAICGYLDLLEQEEKTKTVQRYLLQIKNRTETLKQLTEELFRYSIVTSVSGISLQKTDLCRALEESLISFYGAMKQKSITPKITMPGHRIDRMLDVSSVNRIFGNVISNALKYSDGDLEVRMDKTGTVIFSNTAKDLTPVAVERLFDRYYTVETGRHATGLGLSIAKLLTERMGGSISADCRGGRLRIIIHFPEIKDPNIHTSMAARLTCCSQPDNNCCG